MFRFLRNLFAIKDLAVSNVNITHRACRIHKVPLRLDLAGVRHCPLCRAEVDRQSPPSVEADKLRREIEEVAGLQERV